jgi:catalase
MGGFGVHTFSMIDARGARLWCRFHALSLQGNRTLPDADAAARIGEDRDAAQRDLLDAIGRGEFPKWRLCVQCMTTDEAEAFGWKAFDPTKVWPHAAHPLIPIGELELNRIASDHCEEIEQAAFRPSALVPGIEPSPDPLLRARLLTYADAQFHRLGTAHERAEINAPRCPVRGLVGGAAALLGSGMRGASASASWARADSAWVRAEAIAARMMDATDHDDFSQPGALFRMLDERHRERLAARLARSLGQATMSVQMRQIALLLRADEEYGARVAQRLGLDANQLASARPRVSPSTLMTSGAD